MRKPQKIVSDRINNVYREYGRSVSEPRGSKNDCESKAALEQSACRRAYTALNSHDRCNIDHALQVLSDKAGLQQTAAYHVLMRLGLVLSANKD